MKKKKELDTCKTFFPSKMHFFLEFQGFRISIYSDTLFSIFWTTFFQLLSFRKKPTNEVGKHSFVSYFLKERNQVHRNMEMLIRKLNFHFFSKVVQNYFFFKKTFLTYQRFVFQRFKTAKRPRSLKTGNS